jgi:hypothetical protein
MNGKCEIHHNQTQPVFNGPQYIVLKFENIWLSHTLNINRKPNKCLFSER